MRARLRQGRIGCAQCRKSSTPEHASKWIQLRYARGWSAAFVEFFGGLAFIVGLLTRLAALGVALDMLGAILMVKLPGGFFAPKGIEFELSLLAAAATLAVTGAGALSLDAAIDRRRALASTPTVGPRPTGA